MCVSLSHARQKTRAKWQRTVSVRVTQALIKFNAKAQFGAEIRIESSGIFGQRKVMQSIMHAIYLLLLLPSSST